MSEPKFRTGLTYDDVILQPRHSAIHPRDARLVTRLTRKITLNIPLLSSAMDTVTEAQTAITMAREGGIGFIHRNMSVKSQAMEVDQVKKSESGMIVDPLTIDPDRPIEEVMALMARYRISGVPVTRGDQLVGIVTSRDMRFEKKLDDPVRNIILRGLLRWRDLVSATDGDRQDTYLSLLLSLEI